MGLRRSRAEFVQPLLMQARERADSRSRVMIGRTGGDKQPGAERAATPSLCWHVVVRCRRAAAVHILCRASAVGRSSSLERRVYPLLLPPSRRNPMALPARSLRYITAGAGAWRPRAFLRPPYTAAAEHRRRASPPALFIPHLFCLRSPPSVFCRLSRVALLLSY